MLGHTGEAGPRAFLAFLIAVANEVSLLRKRVLGSLTTR